VIDCSAVIDQVLEGFRHRARATGLDLDTAPGDNDRLFVLADRDRLGQMMGNLVENAARFATSRITVGSGRLGSSVTLWVEDDGPGIPPEEIPRVFERHFSSDQSSPGRHGTGLGLAIVAELASAMRATVQVQSPASGGRGTRFILLFAPTDAPQLSGPQPIRPEPIRPQPTSGSGLASAPTSTE